MKNYLLGVIIFIAGAVICNAASPLEFFNTSDTVRGTIEDDELIAYAQVRNLTDQTVEFNLVMDFPKLTLGHEAALCWDLCFDYTDQNFTSPEIYTIEPLSQSKPGQFTGHLHPYKRISIDPLLYTNPVEGTSRVRYTFTPVGGSAAVSAEYIVTFIVTDPTSVDDELNFSLSSVYPNPANDVLSVNLGNGFDANSTITIYDLSGKALKTLDVAARSTNEVISVSDLSNGTYMLNIRKGNQLRTKKFTVSR